MKVSINPIYLCLLSAAIVSRAAVVTGSSPANTADNPAAPVKVFAGQESFQTWSPQKLTTTPIVHRRDGSLVIFPRAIRQVYFDPLPEYLAPSAPGGQQGLHVPQQPQDVGIQRYQQRPHGERLQQYPRRPPTFGDHRYPPRPETVRTQEYPQRPQEVQVQRYPQQPETVRAQQYPQQPETVRTQQYPRLPQGVQTQQYPQRPETVRIQQYPRQPQAARVQKYSHRQRTVRIQQPSRRPHEAVRGQQVSQAAHPQAQLGVSAANYAFEYEVQYPPSGVHFGHQESRDGPDVTGLYHVTLPDGRMQVVGYSANRAGYVANVQYVTESRAA